MVTLIRKSFDQLGGPHTEVSTKILALLTSQAHEMTVGIPKEVAAVASGTWKISSASCSSTARPAQLCDPHHM